MATVDAERFEARCWCHWPAVCRYLRSRGAGEACEDLASEVFRLAWTKRERIGRDALPWLLRTAHNLLRNHLRSEHARNRLTTELGHVVSLSTEIDTTSSHDGHAVLAALRRLSERDREALLLIVWDDLTPAQAATALGCSGAAFRVRLHRARKRLARQLAEDPDVSLFPIALISGETHA